MKQCIRYIRSYKLLTFAVLALIAGLLLAHYRQPLAAHLILGGTAAIAAIVLLSRMWSEFRGGRFSLDVAGLTAIVVALVLRQYVVALAVAIVLLASRLLLSIALNKAQTDVHRLRVRAPQTAHAIRKNKRLDVSASSLNAREKIAVEVGDIVPADALIVDGSGSFDEAGLTGEHVPAFREVGDIILAGSVNVEGSVTAQVLHRLADSQYRHITGILEASAEHPAPFARLLDTYSIPLTIAAFTIAGVAWILGRHAIRFLDVLVIASPFPLLATVVAFVAAASRASRDGIIFKTGGALEQLATTKTIAFDKTGTLTFAAATTDAIVSAPGFTDEAVLITAASIYQRSSDVLADALKAAAADRSLKLLKVKHATGSTAQGVEARIGSHNTLVGSREFLAARAVAIPAAVRAAKISQSVLFVAINEKFAGYITFNDALRDDAKPTFHKFKRFGVQQTLLVTSMPHAAALATARQLGITTVKAEASPSDKLQALEAVSSRPLAYIGNGVSDVPLLTAADVSVIIGARGKVKASETASVLIMQNSLSRTAEAIAIAKRGLRIAVQSATIGIVLSMGLMCLFATGRFPAVYGAIAQGAIDIIVVMSILRAQNSKHGL